MRGRSRAQEGDPGQCKQRGGGNDPRWAPIRARDRRARCRLWAAHLGGGRRDRYPRVRRRLRRRGRRRRRPLTPAGRWSSARLTHRCRRRRSRRGSDALRPHSPCRSSRRARRCGGGVADTDVDRRPLGTVRCLPLRGRHWSSDRCRLGRRGGGRRRRRGRRRRPRSGRQQGQRVDVALGVVGAPDPEMDVGDIELRVAGRADRADRLSLRDSVAGIDHDRSEMEERDGESVLRPDRDRSTMARQPAGERDLPCRGSGHNGTRNTSDVDSRVAMLVVLGAAEVERTKQMAVRGPGPRASSRRPDEAKREHHKGRCLSRQHRRRT
jgi:hypothetical protein